MDPSTTFLQVVRLTPSGHPIHLPSEIELTILSPIDLDPKENPSPHPSSPQPYSSPPTASSSSLTPPPPPVLSPSPPSSTPSPQEVPQVHIRQPPRSDPGPNGSRSEMLKLILRGGKGDLDGFFEKLWVGMRAKAWEVRREVEEAEREEALRVRVLVVGVSGNLRKEQEIWESTDKSLQDVFQDLNALMSKAKEMVMLAEKMRLKLLSGSSAQASAGDEEMGSKQEMQDWLLSVGFISLVTKESAGTLYHQQLSRQLMWKAGGTASMLLEQRKLWQDLRDPQHRGCLIWRLA